MVNGYARIFWIEMLRASRMRQTERRRRGFNNCLPPRLDSATSTPNSPSPNHTFPNQSSPCLATTVEVLLPRDVPPRRPLALRHPLPSRHALHRLPHTLLSNSTLLLRLPLLLSRALVPVSLARWLVPLRESFPTDFGLEASI